MQTKSLVGWLVGLFKILWLNASRESFWKLRTFCDCCRCRCCYCCCWCCCRYVYLDSVVLAVAVEVAVLLYSLLQRKTYKNWKQQLEKKQHKRNVTQHSNRTRKRLRLRTRGLEALLYARQHRNTLNGDDDKVISSNLLMQNFFLNTHIYLHVFFLETLEVSPCVSLREGVTTVCVPTHQPASQPYSHTVNPSASQAALKAYQPCLTF